MLLLRPAGPPAVHYRSCVVLESLTLVKMVIQTRHLRLVSCLGRGSPDLANRRVSIFPLGFARVENNYLIELANGKIEMRLLQHKE